MKLDLKPRQCKGCGVCHLTPLWRESVFYCDTCRQKLDAIDYVPPPPEFPFAQAPPPVRRR